MGVPLGRQVDPALRPAQLRRAPARDRHASSPRVIALLVATPLGLGAAIYLSEYARPRVRKTIKPMLEMLAGVPTIVFGYFALTFFTPEILQDLLQRGASSIFNALAAGIVMGFMILPTIASVAEDAMSAVPAVAPRGRVRARVLEAPRVPAGGVPGGPVGDRRGDRARRLARDRRDDDRAHRRGQIAEQLARPARARTTRSRRSSARPPKGDIATGSIEYKTIFAVGMLLFIITLLMNLISIRFVRRYRQVVRVSAHGQAIGKAPTSPARRRTRASGSSCSACLGLSVAPAGRPPRRRGCSTGPRT